MRQVVSNNIYPRPSYWLTGTAAHKKRVKLRLMYQRGSFCQRCKLFSEDPDSFTIDHIIPHKTGFKGSWYHKLNNIQLLCYKCNQTKNALENSFRHKWATGNNQYNRKENYIILLNGFATPKEAVEAMQQQDKDFSNILLN